jgi:hypothetical protein
MYSPTNKNAVNKTLIVELLFNCTVTVCPNVSQLYMEQYLNWFCCEALGAGTTVTAVVLFVEPKFFAGVITVDVTVLYEA